MEILYSDNWNITADPPFQMPLGSETDMFCATSQIIIFQEFLFCVNKFRANQAVSSEVPCINDILE